MQIDPAQLHEQPKPRPQFRTFRALAVALGVVAVCLLIIAVPTVYAGYSLVREAEAGRTALVRAADEAGELDFGSATVSLEEAAAHFQKASNSGLILIPFEAVPYVGEQLHGARVLVSSSLKTTDALLKVSRIGEKILGTLSRAKGFDAKAPTVSGGAVAFFRLDPDDRLAVLEALSQVPEDFSKSVAEIDDALTGFKSLPAGRYFDPIQNALTPVVSRLEELRDQLTASVKLAELLPALSGYPAPKNYLIMLQNNYEMRPTGGFIGTVGSVTIANAEATSLKAMDVYAIDSLAEPTLKTVPPAPLRQYLAATKWFLRDSNWSPDFPTAAQKALELYRLEGGTEDFSGVIAVDPILAEDLLAIVGNVKIGTSVFTPANVTDEIEYQVEKGFDAKGLPVAQRKDILVALVDEVFRRIMALPSGDWQKVVDALTRNLEEKHVLIASTDPTVSSFVRERNWDGALRQAQGDALMVVDANLAAYKTDSVMTRSVKYVLRPDGDGYIATVALKYTNNGGFNWKTTRYRTYTRIYVPAGSEFIRGAGMMKNDKIIDPKRTPGTVDVGDELGRRYFGAFLSVEPKETREMFFEYRLPAAVAKEIKDGKYDLLVQKQPGLVAVPLTLDLDFGKNVKSAVPGEDPINWGNTRYTLSTDLRTDREFTVGF